MTCNYKNRMNPNTRWVGKIEDTQIKITSISEEEYIKETFEQYGIEIVTQKDKLIKALKQGNYVIGIDFNPFLFQNVFHYDNMKFEFFKFANAGKHLLAPLRLERITSVMLPKANNLAFELLVENMPHYDEFIVCRKGGLLNIENIPPSITSLIKQVNH